MDVGKKLRILHVVPSLDPADGGPSVAVPMLAAAVAGVGVNVTVLTTLRNREPPTVIGYPLSVIRTEVGSQRSDIGRQSSEIGRQKSDIRHRAVAASLSRGAGQGGEQRAERERPTPNDRTRRHSAVATALRAKNAGQSSVVRGPLSVVDDDIEYVFTQRSTRFYKVSWELVRWLRANIRDFDLVHIHALFSFSSTAAAFIAAKKKVPYIVRPLGVLNRWGRENRRAILKRASLASIEKRILTRAAAIHYTSEAEKAEACNIGDWVKELPSFVIPLPVETERGAGSREQGAESREPATAGSSIGEHGARKGNLTSDLRRPTSGLTSDLRHLTSETNAPSPEPTGRVTGSQLSVNREEQGIPNPTSDVGHLMSETRGRRVVLFLSRIDRKKGIELLLSAFATVRSEFPDLALVIAGSGDQRYEAALREKAKQLKIEHDVIWTGFLNGDDKAAALAAAEIFVLPSYSENFGIAAAEAFAAGKACVLSDQVGLAEDARRANAAVVTRCDVRELTEAIKKLLIDPEQRRALGDAARRFVEEYLSLEAVGRQLDAAYRAALRSPRVIG